MQQLLDDSDDEDNHDLLTALAEEVGEGDDYGGHCYVFLTQQACLAFCVLSARQ